MNDQDQWGHGVFGSVVTRREVLRRATFAATALALPFPLNACGQSNESDGEVAAAPEEPGASLYDTPQPEDLQRFTEWTSVLRSEGLANAGVPLGLAAVRVGELAIGTPYEAFTLEQYLHTGGSPMRTEPLYLSLTRFDCVSLVESCIAIARAARTPGEPSWDHFAREMEKMRYRGGERAGYISRLHYFSEWISDGESRGLVRDLGDEFGGRPDSRPLRFMSEHPDSYPALAERSVLEAIAEIERGLDDQPRMVVPTASIAGVADQIESGDILAFATAIEGLDVTHAAFAYRDEGGVLRVLHAPLSGGVVEVTESTVPEYVGAIRQSTGILVARPV